MHRVLGMSEGGRVMNIYVSYIRLLSRGLSMNGSSPGTFGLSVIWGEAAGDSSNRQAF